MDVLIQVLGILSKFVIIGGGAWAVWGAVTFGGGLHDHNGQQTQTGIWTMIGGGVIIAAGALFTSLVG